MKSKTIISSLLILVLVILYSCKKENNKSFESKIEKITPKKASPDFEARVKKVISLMENLLGVTIDVGFGRHEIHYYPNGQSYTVCYPHEDGICYLKINTTINSQNSGSILSGIIAKKTTGELICCIDETVFTDTYSRFAINKDYINLTSDLVIDDKDILSAFQLEEPLVIEKGNIPYQSIEGITIINLGIH